MDEDLALAEHKHFGQGTVSVLLEVDMVFLVKLSNIPAKKNAYNIESRLHSSFS